MTEFNFGGVCVVVLFFYPWKPRKILLQLRDKTVPIWFLFVESSSTDPWAVH